MLDDAGGLPGGARAIRRALRGRIRSAALVPALAALALCTAPGAAAAETPAPRLRALLGSARLVVSGQASGATSYDDDRVAVITFTADQALKGSLPGIPPIAVSIVELHEGPARAPLTTGMRGIIFLRPVRRTSYLAKTIPPGSYYEQLPEYGSFVAAASKAEADRQYEIVARLLAAARGEALGAAQLRKLTMDLLGAENPLLVEDAAAGLAGFKSQRELSDAELGTIRRAVTRVDVPERVRIALIQAIADAGLTEAVPVLQSIAAPPAVAEAAWQALDRLGSPVPDKDLDARLADQDPSIRAATVRELLHRDGSAAVSRVAPVAVQDPDPSVRRAAVDALGALGTPEALPPLERVFADSSGELQQATGRAILAVGGAPAIDAFGRLAFVGPITSQRYAVVLLMVIDDPQKAEVLQRIASTHEDPQIRDLIEHGFPAHEH
jgi:hypothetical protein